MLTLDLPGYDLVIYFSQSFHLLGLSSDLLFRGALFDGECIHGVVNPSHQSASNTVHSPLGIGHYYAILSLSRARHFVTGCVTCRYSQTRCSTLRCVISLSFRSRALKAPVGSKQWLQLLSDEEFSLLWFWCRDYTKFKGPHAQENRHASHNLIRSVRVDFLSHKHR
jgi:hypothetical protein